MKRNERARSMRLAALLLALMTAAALLLPLGAAALTPGRVVRVGWYESPFNKTDETGRRSGYAYEYQQKIAAYTGWTYEYVEGSWPELLQMLIDGKIDLLSDVSYTEQRAESMLFSTLAMGAEEYYLFAAPDNREITLDDYSTFNGKKVGVNKNSVQVGFLREWAEHNGVELTVREMTESVDMAIAMLNRGEIDLYVMLDAYFDIQYAVPICKVGESDYYFAVSNACPELLPELNAAMSRIREENEYYNQQLNAKYIKAAAVNLYLSAEELEWLAGHGTIRVGYQDNYLAFCASAPKTGELTGALKDYLRVASDCLENAHLEFEAVAYPTSADAMEALKRGEVDCAFPSNLTEYDGEVQGFLISPALMRTDMTAVVRESEQQTIMKQGRVIVAVNAGNPNYDMFLLDHFPKWRAVYFKDTTECLRAIASGQADCLLISSYRFNNIAELCRRYRLATVSTGVEMDYCFSVRRDDLALYSILSKVAGLVPTATVNSALSYYFTEDAKTDVVGLIRQHLGLVVVLAAAVTLVILLLLLRNAWMQRKADKGRQLITATETDELTGLYNRSYFLEYAERMHRERPEKPMDAIVLNIEHFHAVKTLKGRDFSNESLQVVGRGILDYLQKNGGIATREETDRFSLYCPHEEDWHPLLDSLQNALDMLSPNVCIRLCMGVMPWQEDIEPQAQVEQARLACSVARGSFNEHLVVFDDALRQRETKEYRLLNDLRTALKNREFEVFYQPKYSIQTEPPQLISAEALVRWRHPQMGLIPPGEFIPLLERNGEIGAVDKYVWGEAARQVAAWKKKYGVALPVSVNLSRVDVFDPTLENTLDTLLTENGLSHGDLKLEVTESACSEDGFRVVDVIERLRRKGYEIEMDDFGSGYSSLNMLSAMPVDVLKMDRAFVSNIEHEEKDLQLVKLILGIAQSLKIPVIAEGVETERQLQLLRELGCPFVQGFYFSRPLPAAEFEAALLHRPDPA